MSTKKIMLYNVKKAAEYVTGKNVNSVCFWALYQPKLSKKCVERFKK